MNWFSTVFRTAVLDEDAFREWREPPNLFLRGIALVVVVSLLAGLTTFAMNLVQSVRPVDKEAIRESIEQGFRMQSRWNPAYQEPAMREMMEELRKVIIPMVIDLAEVRSPLPRGISGFLQSAGGWISQGLGAIGGWLLYGVLVLVVANLMGGGAKLPEFLGMVSLYAVPGLLGLLSPIPCVGGLIGLLAFGWSIVIYVKAVSMATDLDIGRSLLAVVAPVIVLILVGVLLVMLAILWGLIIF